MKMITAARVEQCMLKVDRANYVNSDKAYSESALPIGMHFTKFDLLMCELRLQRDDIGSSHGC
jgi:protein-L-isoaspartate O-methyltransferase